MNNNDRLIRLRYALNFTDAEMEDIFKLGGSEVTKEDVLRLLTKSNDEAEDELQMTCTNRMLDSFLNGLIIYKRGKQEPKPGQQQPDPSSAPVTNESVNNILLKKVKIALALTSEDMLAILEKAGVSISKSELSAVLRKEGHKNYKPCLDRYARNFLKGLALSYRA
ncbi:DUF1456 family protein [Sporosarcina cyprini]|uniref:DUF1456 family protein n=1 Tax=Sporosarcina cyprini TaxID=2910523 RepID=UPI001EDCF88F|nr:DUF1456 family protein [Sporosarcina cyprini]MCG3088377.1 DUF1456 family protein [Sporosarcina cyprini]